ncbi:multicomponent K+:H+ antiporter subunit F [Gemmobacter aquatilis]|uniref:Multicomponent K+:H+ antiporter subunit F n=1 Tax=Gemmobacter aquatilis TaxID=933059 RepID=A0A1H8IYV6_9RHOB|nr:K+/H+ antiporter subunit F [Gemmobacter aquatilis]SEN73236.1 multicomponent K+:H+ antiporter subunit F [Gemmobacter aquatilis]
MITLALYYAFACFGLGLLITLWRVVFSPSIPDRILALDTMVVNVIALIVLFGMITGSGLYFEAALLFAMTGFVSSVAYAKFILRGDIIE